MTIREEQQDRLRRQGYIIIHEAELGCNGIHQQILDRFYRGTAGGAQDVLTQSPDIHGPVQDRVRVKDFLHYKRIDRNTVALRETQYDHLARFGTPPNLRAARRFHFLDVPECARLTAAMLNLVPLELQHPIGTFGIHAIRSFTNVVGGPHQDGFEWGVAYVLARKGDGARSYLLQGGSVILDHQLQAGEILLFRDALFFHGATPLIPPPDGAAYRDALIIQLDAPEDIEAAREEGDVWTHGV